MINSVVQRPRPLIGMRNLYKLIETIGSEKSNINSVELISRTNHEDVLLHSRAIHLHKDLVQNAITCAFSRLAHFATSNAW